MGAPTAQIQSSQTSQPASKGAGVSPSTPSGSGKGGQLSAMSGQPRMGQPNNNSNTPLNSVAAYMNSGNQPNAGFVAQPDGSTPGNPYPNTISNMGSVAGGRNGTPYQDLPNQPSGQPMAKGGGGGQGGGKGAAGGMVEHGGEFNPNMLIENTYHPGGYQGPGANY